MIDPTIILLDIYRLQIAGNTPYLPVLQSKYPDHRIEHELEKLLEDGQIEERPVKVGIKWVRACWITSAEVLNQCRIMNQEITR